MGIEISSRDLTNIHKFANDVHKLSQLEHPCMACHVGKAHRLPFPGRFEKATNVEQMIHSDIVGTLELSYGDGNQYVCSFLDGHSTYTPFGFL